MQENDSETGWYGIPRQSLLNRVLALATAVAALQRAC